MKPISDDVINDMRNIFTQNKTENSNKILFDLYQFEFSYDFALEFMRFYDEFELILMSLFYDYYSNYILKTIYMNDNNLVLRYEDLNMKYNNESYGIKDKQYIFEYSIPSKFITQNLVDALSKFKIKKYDNILKRILNDRT